MPQTDSSTHAGDLLRSAVLRERAGDLVAAERIVRRLLSEAPDQADAQALLARILFRRGRMDSAAELLERAVSLAPRSPALRHDLGVVCQALGRKDAAVAAFRAAAELSPGEAARQEALAVALLSNKEEEDAEAAFRRALALDPAREETRVRLGDLLQRQGRLEEAIACYRASAEALGDYAPLFNNLGCALRAAGKPEEAIAAHRRAIALKPKEARYWTNLGVAEFDARHQEEALAAFETCLALDPTDRRGLAYRSIVEGELGRLDRAARERELAQWVRPQSLEAPEGYRDVDELNRALSHELETHRSLRWEPLGTATTGGADVLQLLQYPTPAIAAFHGALLKLLDGFIAGLRPEKGHPLLDRLPDRYELDIWATVLKAGGHQAAHIHPTGWLSGVYYVQLLDRQASDSPEAGWIEFGRPPDSFALTHQPVVSRVEPREGLALLFPSYFYHRTLPFGGARNRIAIAFDLRPLAWAGQ